VQASGAWLDPRYNGSGFIFEQLDEQRIAGIWFGFDGAGNQIWLSGIAQQGVAGYAGTYLQPTGPRFGPTYDPHAFNPQPVGALSQNTFNCSSGSAIVQGFPGLPDSLLPYPLSLSRITFPADVAHCGN
jgi:hypothetical protein